MESSSKINKEGGFTSRSTLSRTTDRTTPVRLLQKNEMFSPEEKERQRKLATVVSGKIEDSDPLVYVDVSDRRSQGERRTPFVLRNQGKSVAHKLQIKPIELSVGKAVFTEVDTLFVGATVEVLPV